MKWTPVDKYNWQAALESETLPARIRQLDAATFAVYRAGRYLGCEHTLSAAQERAALNVRSEINREMDWQRAHPDEQPLGLRLTPEERARGWQDTPPRARAAPVLPSAGQRLVTAVKEAAAREAKEHADPPAGTTGGSRNKTAIIAALLRREEGCTSEEVLRACGWTAVSMPQQAKQAGLGLRIDKSRKPFRYYAEKGK